VCASGFLLFAFAKILPSSFLLLAGLGHIDGVGSSVFVASIGGDMKWPACSIGNHVRSQNFCPSEMPRSRRYGDVTVAYIHRAKIPSRIYAKPQYREYIYEPQ